MRKEITIGEETVEMAASAATPFIFHKIFGEDLLRTMQIDPENVNTYIKLAFTMARQADTPTTDLMKGSASYDDFIVWLDKFEMLDLMESVKDVLQLYQASKKGTSVPKTKAD